MAKSPDQEADVSTDGGEKKFVCPVCGDEFDSAKGRGTHRRWNHDNPWEHESKLRSEYVDNGKSIPTIADEWNCGETTIEQWLDKHDIDTRDRGGHPNDAKWKDADKLRELYHEQGLSLSEIADKYGVAYSTIHNACIRNGVETKELGGRGKDALYKDREWLLQKYKQERVPATQIAEMADCSETTIFKQLRKYDIDRFHATETYDGGGTIPYSVIYHREDNRNHFILIHRLVAYAHGELSGEELLNGEKDVHHKNNNPWMNSIENLQVVTPSEHQQLHAED